MKIKKEKPKVLPPIELMRYQYHWLIQPDNNNIIAELSGEEWFFFGTDLTSSPEELYEEGWKYDKAVLY